MQISDALAFEIYTINFFHIFTVLLLLGFTFYLYFKAKKTPLLYSYLALVAMLVFWMISKILKTVSPNEGIRWFFILTQYFCVQFLGFCLIVFASIYVKDKIPSRKALIMIAIPPMISFLIVLTNPLHMLFYSYYDFYKDRFGSLFLPTQTIQYLYLMIGIILLSIGFTNQPAFRNKKLPAYIFAGLTLLPILFNVYYILFKLTDIPWVFPFPIFDFTPIAGSIALILFMIPALKYRFLDISPISHLHIFDHIPEGIVFLNAKNVLHTGNHAFINLFPSAYQKSDLFRFTDSLPFAFEQDKEKFLNFLCQKKNSETPFLLRLKGSVFYKVMLTSINKSTTLLCFIDLTKTIRLNNQLEEKNRALSDTNLKLEALAEATRELAITKTKTAIAQNVHDILGHSLTVVIATADLACMEEDRTLISSKLTQITELLISSLSDLRNSISGKEFELNQTTLTKAIAQLKNPNIILDFVSQGKPYELNTKQTEAIFRLCQEAVTNSIKHGKAKTIHIILRFQPDGIELFAIDDGAGCKTMKKNYGLTGMENRIMTLGGTVVFGSDGINGFHIHARIPRADQTVQ